jgi:peptidoglycan/LPS O-acetylase OafA/YrhL
MNHTWSLSVEELFYLIWPLIILAVRPKTLLSLIWVIGLGSILYKIIMLCFFYSPSTDQLLLLSMTGNLDGLMSGALLGFFSLDKNSFLYRTFPTRQAFAVLLLFLIVIGANYFRFDQALLNSFFKEGLSVVSVILSFYCLAWFISSGKPTLLLNSFFRNRFLRFTGKISYGLYLYHALIFGILDAYCYHFKINIGAVNLFLIKLTLSYTAAIVSWQWIEKPFLSRKNRLHYGDEKV